MKACIHSYVAVGAAECVSAYVAILTIKMVKRP